MISVLRFENKMPMQVIDFPWVTTIFRQISRYLRVFLTHKGLVSRRLRKKPGLFEFAEEIAELESTQKCRADSDYFRTGNRLEENQKWLATDGTDCTEGNGRDSKALIKMKIRIMRGLEEVKLTIGRRAGGVIETGSAFMRKRVGQP
jgi:hypothetical protein